MYAARVSWWPCPRSRGGPMMNWKLSFDLRFPVSGSTASVKASMTFVRARGARPS